MPFPKPISTVLIAVLIHATTFSPPVFARSAMSRNERVRAAVAKMEVGPETRVAVKLRNNKVVYGYLAAVGSHSLFVTDAETQISTQVPFRNVKQISAMSTHAKIGIAVGAALATVLVLVWLNCYLSEACQG